MKKFLTLFPFLLTTIVVSAQPSIQWQNRFNGQGDFSDKTVAVVTDASNNIYVTGYTFRTSKEEDVLTIKMNSSGDTIWTRTYNGTDNNTDEGTDIAVDASGNVYVTGYAKGLNSNKDYITIKYNSTGDTLWTRRYNGPGNGDDVANSIAVDAAGNVFITGQSDGNPAIIVDNDFATIMYNSAGVQQWVKRYVGTGSGTDDAYGIVVDAASNCYVTGRTQNPSDDDYATIKYNSAGVQQWVKVFDGGNGNDRATAIAIDASANIYVTGRYDNGSDDDYVTIKYTTAGVQQWLKYYDGNYGDDRASAITVDGSGNVYVTGKSFHFNSLTTVVSDDYATVKYNAAGTQQWVSYFAGAANGIDAASSIVLDATGNVYVTGQSDGDPSAALNYNYATVKYNSAGAQQWFQTYNGTANAADAGNSLAVDAANGIIVTGNSQNTGTQKDATTIKYDATGNATWTKHYRGEGDNSDKTNAIVVDAAGFTYTTGYTYANGIGKNYCTTKYNTSGDTIWVRVYNGGGNGNDEATALAVDAAGNVYITGAAKSIAGNKDYLTIKYTTNGDTIWVRHYDGAGFGDDYATALKVDASGNVYVTGYSDEDTSPFFTNDDYVTIKYNSAGVQQWVSSFNGSANLNDRATSLVVDGSGNATVTGRSSSPTDYDIVTVRYNSSGAQQWATPYSGTFGDDKGIAMTSDASGNIYVAGSSDSNSDTSSTLNDYVTIKYSGAGAQQWAMRYNGTGNDDDVPTAIALDNSGNVYVTGQSDVDTALLIKNYDYLTLKYNTSGALQWAKNYNGAANADDIASSIIVDGNGDIVVAGQANNGTALVKNNDFTIVKYSTTGGLYWAVSFDGGANSGSDGINALAIDNLNNIYVTGSSYSLAGQKDIVTIKYNSPSAVNEINESLIDISVYPNPFSTTATLVISSPDKVMLNGISFNLYDVLGNKLGSIPNISSDKVIIERKDLSAGVYFYTLSNEIGVLKSGKVMVQ